MYQPENPTGEECTVLTDRQPTLTSRPIFPSHVQEVLSAHEGTELLKHSAINGTLVPSALRQNLEELPHLAEALQGVSLHIKGSESDLNNIEAPILDALKLQGKSNDLVQQELRSWVNDMQSIGQAVFDFCTPEVRGFGLITNPHQGSAYHTDQGLLVGLVAYRGNGTVFIPNSDVNPGTRGRVFAKSGAKEYQAETNDLLLIRGRLALPGFEEGLVHKAPLVKGQDRMIFFAYGRPDPERLQPVL